MTESDRTLIAYYIAATLRAEVAERERDDWRRVAEEARAAQEAAERRYAELAVRAIESARQRKSEGGT